MVEEKSRLFLPRLRNSQFFLISANPYPGERVRRKKSIWICCSSTMMEGVSLIPVQVKGSKPDCFPGIGIGESSSEQSQRDQGQC